MSPLRKLFAVMLMSVCGATMLPAAGQHYLLDSSPHDTLRIERVTTVAPFPRGLAMRDGKLHVLCRGRVRGAGGVSAEIEDQAGTIYIVNPNIGQSFDEEIVSEQVRRNGTPFVLPTDPPFALWNRNAYPPASDHRTDRPYCSLRWHQATQSFYICAFSGIDLPKTAGGESFSKNRNDAILRYDLRSNKWYDVERHDSSADRRYPHHDSSVNAPPHGWLNGPDNCLIVGNNLYAVAKDNSVLVRYDLSALMHDPEAGPPPSEFVLGSELLRGAGDPIQCEGHSALAYRNNYLYLGCRTSSVIVRIPLDHDGLPVQPIRGELIARFQPYNAQTGESANITDMDFDSAGRLYVMSAEPARIYRFTPDAANVFDATDVSQTQPWLDLATHTRNPKMKAENVMIDDQDRVFITSGQGYGYQQGADGTVWRVTELVH